MKKENNKKVLIVVPYRDSYFASRIGFAVRDLQICEEIKRSRYFDEIYFINRPVTVYERLLIKGKRSKKTINGYNVKDKTSFNLISGLTKRVFMVDCFRDSVVEVIKKIESRYLDPKVVLLDFHPIAQIDRGLVGGIYMWYDMIDNFIKHNRFSLSDKKLVKKKYIMVGRDYNYVTGVSSEALMEIRNENKFAFSNGVFYDENELSFKNIKKYEKVFDFGYIGFITDKLDVEYLKWLKGKGFSVCLWGKCFDGAIEKIISKEFEYKGQFKYSNLVEVMQTFNVGLINYKKEMRHDGSPLKLYEYLKYNKPVVSLEKYEVINKYVLSGEINAYDIKKLREIIAYSGEKEISSLIEDEWLMKNKVKKALENIDMYFK